MGLLLKWAGNGLTAGALTTGSAGTGDTAPSALAGPTGKHKIENAGVRAPRILIDDAVSTTAGSAVFTISSERTVYAVRVYFSIGGYVFSGSGPVITGRPFGTGVAWRLDISSTGALRFRGSGGTAIDSPGSPLLAVGTVYRFELVATGTTAAYYVYEGDNSTPIYSRADLPIGGPFGDLVLGQSNPAVPNPRYDDIMVDSTAALIGPVVAEQVVVGTNTFFDPHLTSDTSIVQAGTNLPTMVRSTEQTFEGRSTIKVTFTATGASGFTAGRVISFPSVTHAPGTTVRYSVWIHNRPTGLYVYPTGGLAFSQMLLVEGTQAGWGRYEVIGTRLSTDSNVNIYVAMFNASTSPLPAFYIGPVSQVIGDGHSFAGSTPADGTYSYRWTGTPNASASEKLTQQGPPPPPPAPPGQLLAWKGDGLAAGTLTTLSAGPGDTAPSAVGGPTGKMKIEAALIRSPRIWVDQSVSETNANATFSLAANRTVYAVRVYFSVGGWHAPATAGAIVGRPLGSGVSWRLDFSTTGAIRFRGIDGAALDSPATTLDLDTTYRFEMTVENGAAKYYIYHSDSMTLVYSRTTGLTVGTQFGDLLLGQVLSTLTSLRFDDIAIYDSATLIGSVIPPAAHAPWRLVTAGAPALVIPRAVV